MIRKVSKFLFILLLAFVISCNDDPISTNEYQDTEEPAIAISYPANNSEYDAGTIIVIKAVAVDNEKITKVEFYINDSLMSTVKLPPYEYIWDTNKMVGIHTIKVTAIDKSGNIGESDIYKIHIKNRVPTASFIVHPSSGTISTTFQFDASGSNDGEDMLSQLQFSWDWENDGLWDIESSTDYSISHQYESEGSKIVRLRVTDTGGLNNELTDTIQVFQSIPFLLSEMVLVEGGTFFMGDTWGDGNTDEVPIHVISLNSFFMTKYEITNKNVANVYNQALSLGRLTVTSTTVTDNIGGNQNLLDIGDSDCQIGYSGGQFVVDPGKEKYPCICISWYGAVAFCNYLSNIENLPVCYNLRTSNCDFEANGYRLPTESEWEYAARGGNQSKGYKYSGSNIAQDVAWCNVFHSFEVGTKLPNELVLYDLSGNAEEWCWDWQGEYPAEMRVNPTGPLAGEYRIARGGYWRTDEWAARVVFRNSDLPTRMGETTGFRIVRTF